MRDQINGFPENEDVAKAQAKRLSAAMGGKREMSHAQALEAVARMHGCRSWGEMRAAFTGQKPSAHQKDGFFTLEDLFWEFREISLWVNLWMPVSMGFRDYSPSRIAHSSLIPPMVEAMDHYVDKSDSSASHEGEDLPLREWMNAKGVDISRAMNDMMTRLGEPPASLLKVPAAGTRDPAGPEKITINGKHTLACCGDLKSVFMALDRSGLEVFDLYRKQKFPSVLTAWNTFDLPTGFVSVNPVSILKALASSVSSFGLDRKPEKVVVVVSGRDMIRTSGTDILLAQVRSLGLHMVVVQDSEIPDNLRSNIEHIWTDAA